MPSHWGACAHPNEISTGSVVRPSSSKDARHEGHQNRQVDDRHRAERQRAKNLHVRLQSKRPRMVALRCGRRCEPSNVWTPCIAFRREPGCLYSMGMMRKTSRRGFTAQGARPDLPFVGVPKRREIRYKPYTPYTGPDRPQTRSHRRWPCASMKSLPPRCCTQLAP